MSEVKNNLKEQLLMDISNREESIANYEKFIEQSQLGIDEMRSQIEKKHKEILVIKAMIENLENLNEDEL